MNHLHHKASAFHEANHLIYFISISMVVDVVFVVVLFQEGFSCVPLDVYYK